MYTQQKGQTNVETLRKENSHEDIRSLLSDDYVGYVLVTCRKTGQLGKMEVEVSYEGDPDLACYLVDGAHSYLENEFSEES